LAVFQFQSLKADEAKMLSRNSTQSWHQAFVAAVRAAGLRHIPRQARSSTTRRCCEVHAVIVYNWPIIRGDREDPASASSGRPTI